MPTVTVTHSDGTTETIAETVGWQYQREIGAMEKLSIDVDRSDAQAITLNRRDDEVDLAGVTTGRLVDIETGGATWTLVVRSFEWDGKKTSPTAGGVRKIDTDQNLMTDFITDVSSWSVGTTSSFTGSLTFIFNHAFPHEAMRRIERNVPGELRWNADKSVDYVQSLGSDKSSSITLSAGQGNLNQAIRITEQGTDLDVTHLRIIGAHEGEAQIETNLVPSGDSGTFTNEVTYTTSRWSDSSDTVWGRWSNKDVADQSTIDEEAGAIADELTETPVEATAVVEGEDLGLGDWVTVQKADAGIDRKMRIHRITTRTTTESVAGTVDEVLLSTRTLARASRENNLRDLQRFNVAFQGSSVIIQGGGERQAVSSSVNAFESFRYPTIGYEHIAEVEVRGLPFRVDSTTNSIDEGAYVNSVPKTYEPGDTRNAGTTAQTVEFVPSTRIGGGSDGIMIEGWIANETGSNQTYSYQIRNQDSGAPVLEDSSIAVNDGTVGHVQDFTNAGWSTGDTIQFRIDGGTVGTTTGRPLGGFGLTILTRTRHDHTLQPGASEFASDVPNNCDLLINGSTVATNIGSGEFVTTVDVSGSFNQGQWNDIEVTSDDLGNVQIRAYVEAYKQIGGQ